MDSDIWWICNNYDISAMPDSVRLEITSDTVAPKRAQSSAEIFRDMYVIVPSLAAMDQTIMRPTLNRAPSVSKFWQASKKGDQQLIEAAFANSLSVCAAASKSMDKYRSVMATPMRDELPRFCNTNVVIEIFTFNVACEMSLSACYQVRCSIFLSRSAPS